MSTPHELFVIQGLAGAKTLSGKIAVSGAKNAALKGLVASILFEGDVHYESIPEIEDTHRIQELLESLGASFRKTGEGTYTVNTDNVNSSDLDEEISKRLRSSTLFMGPLLARTGRVTLPHPGGCVLGARPIDLFLKGFEKMGGTVEHDGERYVITARNGTLKGADIFFRVQSHTGTEALMMAAVLAEGTTTLRNAAMEPEVEHLAYFLNSAGARIRGAGTPTITIEGTGGKLLQAKEPYRTLPDRIEAGSFLILGALCADNLEIADCRPEHVNALIEMLREAGVAIQTTQSSIVLEGNGSVSNSSFQNVSVKTHEYPGFVTDLQAPMTVFLTQATGESIVFETIFEARLNFTEDLVRMGANILQLDAHRVLVKGSTPLKRRSLESPDLRAGLAFIIAALVAEGESTIGNIYYIDRGYAHIEERLRALGANIERVAYKDHGTVW